jgi:chromate reductase
VDAILFVTPEYNRSIPGGLKNAIDWASRPWGENSFTRKPSAVIGACIGA